MKMETLYNSKATMETLWENSYLFNKLYKTFNDLTFDDVKDYRVIVRAVYHNRDKNGDLILEGIKCHLPISKLSELPQFRRDCQDAYLIKEIIIYQDTDEDYPNGLHLDESHKLGFEIMAKYNKYSYSWFKGDPDNSDYPDSD